MTHRKNIGKIRKIGMLVLLCHIVALAATVPLCGCSNLGWKANAKNGRVSGYARPGLVFRQNSEWYFGIDGETRVSSDVEGEVSGTTKTTTTVTETTTPPAQPVGVETK